MRVLRETKSLCPVCLRTLPAVLKERGGEVRMERSCPEHGAFSAVIWRGEPDFSAWKRPKSPSGAGHRETRRDKGCPHDCGLCEEHRQHTCTVLFEITYACNLRCPVCFASAGGSAASFTSLAELEEQLRWIAARTPDAVLQISGGEPTLHPDLPALVKIAAGLFPAVQLNTNGILLAQRPDLCGELAEAGLSWVFLQFDGTTDDIFETMRGARLLKEKIRAIENCRDARLTVVLVPTLARGVNDGNLGEMLDFALAYSPAVRGIHIQPMADMGRNFVNHPEPRAATARSADYGITLPEVLYSLARQSRGRIKIEHAMPPGCEHERCSFHCRYILDEAKNLVPVREQACCVSDAMGQGSGRSQVSSAPPPLAGAAGAEAAPQVGTAHGDVVPAGDDGGMKRAVSSIIRSWGAPKQNAPGQEPAGLDEDDAFSRFIRKARGQSFSVTCMAFQDATNVDLERLQGCCVNVFAPPNRLMPFCAYNLTSVNGTPLHRGKNGTGGQR